MKVHYTKKKYGESIKVDSPCGEKSGAFTNIKKDVTCDNCLKQLSQ